LRELKFMSESSAIAADDEKTGAVNGTREGDSKIYVDEFT
jgi:hypothetical protein